MSAITTQERIAEALLQVKAVKLQPDSPFTWASGWKSPIYCDNRVTLSYPEVRTLIKTELAEAIRREFDAPDVVAGVATGAIAQGALVADLLGLPFVYIRPVAKDHGMGNQIEGELPAGSRVLVVEDLISTGGSSLKAVDAIRRAGCSVLGMVAVYTHGFPQAEQAFAEAGVRLVTLSCYDAVIRQALRATSQLKTKRSSRSGARILPLGPARSKPYHYLIIRRIHVRLRKFYQGYRRPSYPSISAPLRPEWPG